MRLRSLFSVLMCAAGVSFVLTAQQPGNSTTPASLVTQPIDDTVRVSLPNNVHPLAKPEFDRGEAPEGLPLGRMLMVMKRSSEQDTALEHLLEHQQDVSSPSYHQWLTPRQFGERFGPSSADLDNGPGGKWHRHGLRSRNRQAFGSRLVSLCAFGQNKFVVVES
jgi:subtilase family serine protease